MNIFPWQSEFGQRAALGRPIASLDQRAADDSWDRRVAAVADGALRRLRSRGAAPGQLTKTPGAETLIIVPPFASLYIPSLGAHTLQACAEQAGQKVDILYANMHFAATIGESAYNLVAWEPIGPLAAERVFARAAFPALPPLGRRADDLFDLQQMFGERQAKIYATVMGLSLTAARQRHRRHSQGKLRRLRQIEQRAGLWADQLAAAIAGAGYRIVGSSTTFEQTLCSLALLQRIKARCPDTTTILGGANCEGEMAAGLAELAPDVDFIFSGESDESFPRFINGVRAGYAPNEKILLGKPWERMQDSPTPRFDEFFDQWQRYLPDSRRKIDDVYLTYETSRGCWWGQKQHCTFCGLNGEGMISRQKSAAKVIGELKTLTERYPTANIGMADNIMPHEYFKTLLPTISAELPGLNIFYEQKANMSLAQVLQLKSAGIRTIQPGIEALSSSMLKRMRKGVSAYQNLLLLRHGRIAGLRMLWAILCGFPGDEQQVYSDTLKLCQDIHHLPPPSALWHLTIDRFSPYHSRPDNYGVSNVTPYPSYFDIFPEQSDTNKIAYHFTADYETASEQALPIISALGQDIEAWRRGWRQPYGKRPELKIEPVPGGYLLWDSRGLPGGRRSRMLTRAEAAFLLRHRRYNHQPNQDEAIAQRLAVSIDGWFVPLPVARIDVMLELAYDGDEYRHERAQLEEIGRRRRNDIPALGLVEIACDGPLSHLQHPLAPP